MEMKHYLSILWRWAWLILLATVVAAGLSYWNTSKQPALYQATTTVRVGQFLESANPQAGDLLTSQQLARLYAQRVRGQPVVQAAMDTLGLDGSWQGIASRVHAAAVDGTELLRIGVIDTDPQRAKLIADELARQLVVQSPTVQERELEEQRLFVGGQLTGLKTRIEGAEEKIRTLQAQVDAESSARAIRETQDRIATLEQQIRHWQGTYTGLLDFYRGSRTNYLSVVDAASVPNAPLPSGMLFNLMVAVAIGFLLAAGAALLIEYFDDTVRTEEDVERMLDMPTIGFVARMGKKERTQETPAGLGDPRSATAELYRVLRSNLQFLRFEDPSRPILVTSPGAGEGKSLTAANLAASFALSGKRTILVDADLRRPSAHTYFGVTSESGLTSLFLQESAAPVEHAQNGKSGAAATRPVGPFLGRHVEDFLVDTRVPNLRILPSGPLPPSPAELLGSDRMQKVLNVLGSIADVVIVDSAPLLPVADTTVLASKGMQAVLVTEAGKTRTHAARMAKRILTRARARVLGVVINRAPKRSIPYYSHSYYGAEVDGQGPIQRLFGRRQPSRGMAPGVGPAIVRNVAPDHDESPGL